MNWAVIGLPGFSKSYQLLKSGGIIQERSCFSGETTDNLYGFLTTGANAEVGAIHPKAMPVILTSEQEVETWLMAEPDEALSLQRPLSDGSLTVVGRGSQPPEV